MEIAANHAPKTLEEANQIIALIAKEANQAITTLKEKIETIELQYDNLQNQMINLIRGKYGKKSEKISIGQISLFEGLPGFELPKVEEQPKTETVTYTRKKRNGHRNIPDNLPRERIEYKLQDLTCPCGCGNQLHKIGEVVTEQLEIIPAKIYVRQLVRFKYAGCITGEKVITAPMPNQPIDKGFAGPGLLADVLVNKYDDHLPLYRQSERLARHGIELSRQTLCDWVMQCADILQPIVNEMLPDILASPKIHTDDTVVPIQEEGRSKTKEGRLWGYLGSGPPCVIYEYTPDRKQKWAEGFLKNYQGYLQADAYVGYDKIYKTLNIIEVACMAHARRKFFESEPNKDELKKLPAIIYIGKLYDLERKIKDLCPAAKKAKRKRYATPILKEYKKWLLAKSIRVIPKSPLGQAIAYTLNNWIALTRYLGNGILDIDNNKAERLMRPIAVGRKNWMFAGSDRGGRAAATIYSLIETCKLNNINPYEYLRDILTRIPNTLNRDIKTLLPYNWKQEK
jgi:transposase